MNFSQIKCFLAAAETLSFTRAADRLYLSQPVLSRQIAAMEEELGIDLFVRERKSVRLTPAGELMVKGLRTMSRDWDALVDAAAAVQQGYKGSLNIGMIEGQQVCPPYSDILDGFRAAHPEIRVNLSLHSIASMRLALEDGEIDIAFAARFNMEGVEAVKLLEVGIARTYLVIPASHPLAEKQNLSILDFKDDVFLTLSQTESPHISRFPGSLLKSQGISPKTLVAPDIGTLSLWLEAGYGIFALNENHALRNSPNVRFVEVRGLDPSVEVIAYKSDTINPVAELFMEETKNHIKKMEK